MMTDILALGRAKNLSSYDASYLDLAMRKDCPIATLDKRLVDVGKDISVTIVPAG